MWHRLCAMYVLRFLFSIQTVESTQEYVRLLRLDTSIFEELVGDLPSLENTGVSSEVDTSGESAS
jgi:hypothetical protein